MNKISYLFLTLFTLSMHALLVSPEGQIISRFTTQEPSKLPPEIQRQKDILKWTEGKELFFLALACNHLPENILEKKIHEIMASNPQAFQERCIYTEMPTTPSGNAVAAISGTIYEAIEDSIQQHPESESCKKLKEFIIKVVQRKEEDERQAAIKKQQEQEEAAIKETTKKWTERIQRLTHIKK